MSFHSAIGQLERRRPLRAAGAVDQDVHLAELADRRGEQRRDRRLVGDVGRHAQRPAPRGLDQRGRLVDDVLPARRRHDVGARLREPLRQRAADAGRAADDDGRAARQIQRCERHQCGLPTLTLAADHFAARAAWTADT